MSTGTPEAARNHSRSPLANRAAPSLVSAVRGGLVLLGFAGAALVAVTTFTTVIEISIGGGGSATADFDPNLTGYDRHNVALLLIGLFAAVLHTGAARGARPAMAAVVACGVAVLLIAVLGDAPDLDQAGRVAELYEDTSAQAGIGFYLETMGGALLAIAGVGMLVLGGGAAALGGAVARPRATETDDEIAPEPVATPAVETSEAPSAAGSSPGAPAPTVSPARRFGAGLAAGAAKARQAREEAQARKAERAAAEREREAARAERARVAAAAQASAEAVRAAEARVAEEARKAEEARVAEEARQAEEARVAEETRQAESARAAEAQREAATARAADEARGADAAREAEARAPETPAPAAPAAESGTLSFDERLRQARERARRNRP